MKILNILKEGVEEKILKDPRLSKMISIMFKNDISVPRNQIAIMGPFSKITDEQIVQKWSNMIDAMLREKNIERQEIEKYEIWLTRQYADGHINWEDLSGEALPAIRTYNKLAIRGLLKPQHRDINKFPNLRVLQRTLRENYPAEIRRIEIEAEIQRQKKVKVDQILIDDDRFLVIIPFNYGSCYTFNNAEGIQATFCTGSSTGSSWFSRYAPDGPIISIVDKNNSNNVKGKWQIHAPTNQIVDAEQNRRYDTQANSKEFAQLFPGLGKRIIDAMVQKEDEIVEKSKAMFIQEHQPGLYYNVDEQIALLKKRFPALFQHESGGELDFVYDVDGNRVPRN